MITFGEDLDDGLSTHETEHNVRNCGELNAMWLRGALFLNSVRTLLASSEHLAQLCAAQRCNEPEHPILDYDQDARECVCSSHPCWNDNGLEHTCRGKFGFPFLTFFYNETKHLVCECSSFAHYGSIYVSRDLCPGHRCVDPEHPVLDYDEDTAECVCKSHPCWHDNGRRHTCSEKPGFPLLKMRYHEVDGRLERVCECGISMEKDQSFPLFEYDKPGADPDEADFEDDKEEF